jgi:hypothetical protein
MNEVQNLCDYSYAFICTRAGCSLSIPVITPPHMALPFLTSRTLPFGYNRGRGPVRTKVFSRLTKSYLSLIAPLQYRIQACCASDERLETFKTCHCQLTNYLEPRPTSSSHWLLQPQCDQEVHAPAQNVRGERHDCP